MPGSALTTDWRIELRGYVVGDDTDWEINVLDGLGEPPVRTSDRPRPLRNGAWLGGQDLLDGRTVTVGLECIADTDEERWAAKAALGRAWRTTSSGVLPLAIRVAGRTYLLYGRPRRFAFTDEAPGFEVAATVQFFAGDPVLYSAEETVTVLQLGEAGEGFTFPLTFPLTFGGGTSGITPIVNAGNADVSPTVRLDGPLTLPRLEHVGQGRTLELAGVIAAGQFVEVDFDARTVLLGGTASRYEWVRGQWWDLQPGVNEVRFAAGAGTGTATVRHRDGWSTPGPQGASDG